MSDKSTHVREAAAETLKAGIKLVSQRESMSEYVQMALNSILVPLNTSNTSADKLVGSLSTLNILISGIISNAELLSSIRNQNMKHQDIIWNVMQRRDYYSITGEVRVKVIEIIPNLAAAFYKDFVGENSHTKPITFLQYCFKYLVDMINAKREQNSAYLSLGRLYEIMSEHLKNGVGDAIAAISNGFKDKFCVNALKCLEMVVKSSETARGLVTIKLIDLMFKGGLTRDLIDSLKVVFKHCAHIRSNAQYQLLTHIEMLLKEHKVYIDEAQARSGRQRGELLLAFLTSTGASQPLSRWKRSPAAGSEGSQDVDQLLRQRHSQGGLGGQSPRQCSIVECNHRRHEARGKRYLRDADPRQSGFLP